VYDEEYDDELLLGLFLQIHNEFCKENGYVNLIFDDQLHAQFVQLNVKPAIIPQDGLINSMFPFSSMRNHFFECNANLEYHQKTSERFKLYLF